jgi:putative SOS response-associated peptidase YedK
MCNLYTPVDNHRLMAQFGKAAINQTWGNYVAPLKLGPYLRQQGEVQVGQWGMITPGSKTSKPMGQTNNARRETLATRKTYAQSWKTGMRCLIPAVSFIEPYYSPGAEKSISWRFARADRDAWALAGIWSEWVDPVTGEVLPSYSMITQNCDLHPLLKLMHKPERDKQGNILSPEEQDKRAVVPLERDRWDEWLHGSLEQAEALIVLPAVEVFRHGADNPAKNIPLPGEAATGQNQTDSPLLF